MTQNSVQSSVHSQVFKRYKEFSAVLKKGLIAVALATVALVVVDGLAFVVSTKGVMADASQRPSRPLISYVAPVDCQIIDEFRPPSHIGGSGNRGLEYSCPPQVLVFAAGEGIVSYAGQIAHKNYIAIEHPDGLRTTYSFVDEILVNRDDLVDSSTPIAIAGANTHFGVVMKKHYLDPQVLLAASELPAPKVEVIDVK